MNGHASFLISLAAIISAAKEQAGKSHLRFYQYPSCLYKYETKKMRLPNSSINRIAHPTGTDRWKHIHSTWVCGKLLDLVARMSLIKSHHGWAELKESRSTQS
jgi:hypothetical protein